MSGRVPNQLLKGLVDFYEIQYGDHATEGDLDAVIFNFSFNDCKIADVQTSELCAKLALVNVG
jgi:hypothetical protein